MLKYPVIYLLIVFLLTSCLYKDIVSYDMIVSEEIVNKDMYNAGYWIGNHDLPDILMANSDDIAYFNKSIQDSQLSVTDIMSFDETCDSELIHERIEALYQIVVTDNFYLPDGSRAPGKKRQQWLDNANLDAISGTCHILFGFNSNRAELNLIPAPSDLLFVNSTLKSSTNRFSTLNPSTPLVILHESKDKNWFFVRSNTNMGWVVKDDIILSSKKEVRTYIDNDDFVVVTSCIGEIYLDEMLTDYYGFAHMGHRLLVATDDKKDDKIVTILIPEIDLTGNLRFRTAYVAERQVNDGYLKYTPRNILNQIFKPLKPGYFFQNDEKMYLYQLLAAVFATTGVILPINGVHNPDFGIKIEGFSNNISDLQKLAVIEDELIAGVTVFKMKDKRMLLYLGESNGLHYVIDYRSNRIKIMSLGNEESESKMTVSSLIKNVNHVLPPIINN